MIRMMVIRDMRSRYMGSFLGIFWSIIHPLTQLMIYYFISSIVLKVKLGPDYQDTNFAIWLIAGLLPWMFFAEVINRSPGALLQYASLIKKMVFPFEILPLTHLVTAVINHLIGLLILLGFIFVAGYGVTLTLFGIVPYMLAIGILVMGISWVLSALNVFLRDIGQIIGVLVNIWFFLTPIIYPPHLIPESLQGLFGLNPMLYAVEGYRAAILGKSEIDIAGLSFILVLGIVTFIAGSIIFKKLRTVFSDVL